MTRAADSDFYDFTFTFTFTLYDTRVSQNVPDVTLI